MHGLLMTIKCKFHYMLKQNDTT